MPRNTTRKSQPAPQLVPLAIAVPGSLGLNLQAQGSIQDPKWSIESLNTVIDQNGRVAARLGRTTVSAGHAASGQVRSIFEYRTPAGASQPIVAYDGGISSSLTAPNGSSMVGTITSVANGRWFFQNFFGNCIGFIAGQKPIVCTAPGGTFSNIVEASGSAPQGGVGCAAYGRLWGMAADGFTLQWCALADYTNWAAGDAGSIDLRKVWPQGMDTVTAICGFAGCLVVFGYKQIIVYGSVSNTVLGLDVTQLRVVDAIEGVGCISQWTVAAIGGEKEHSDVLFCSLSGVQSLQRLVLASGSRPIQNLTKNVRDALIAQLKAETNSAISGFYSPSNGFYALSLPASGYTWVVDQRHRFDDQDGDEVSRVTRWPVAHTAMAEFPLARAVYFASNTTGHVYQYIAGTDDGSYFPITLQLPWIDFGDQLNAHLKALKRLGCIVYTRNNLNVTMTWYTDFSSFGTSATATVANGITNAEFSIAQYSIDQWSGGLHLNNATYNGTTTGQYFSLALTCTSDSNFAVQQMSLLAKVLRVA